MSNRPHSSPLIYRDTHQTKKSDRKRIYCRQLIFTSQILSAAFVDRDEPFKVSVYKRIERKFPELIGEFLTTLREWELGPTTYALVHPDKKGRLGYQSSGGFEVKNVVPLSSTSLPPIGTLTY